MTERSGGAARQELVDVIRQVRHRWRAKLLLRGGIVVVGGALLALGLASWGLQQYKFSPASITAFRIGVFAVFALLLGFWFLRPLRRRVTDLQVALYVEEHEPLLQAAILSAVDLGGPSSVQTDVPPVIVERMIEQAVEKCRETAVAATVGQAALRRSAVALGTLTAVTVLLLVVGPEFFRQGASALLVLSRSAEAASPYAIKVEPGDVTIPKGADQTIRARLTGFRSNDVVVMVRPQGEAEYARTPLIAAGEEMLFEGMLFDVASGMEYYVEADGVRSPTYSMTVVELPAVENLELEYIYPAYTGLAPEKIESGGDVAALRGTEVRVRVTPTMASPGGTLQLDPGAPSTLTTQGDGALLGSFKIGEDGYYHVELAGPRGERVTASPKYTIDAIDDQPPAVTFEKPRRDIQANAVEEVFLQARADDDFGVNKVELIYSINGGAEQKVALYGRGAKSLKEVSAGHTVYLEELGVKPGDFLSYYAQVTDTDTVKGPKSAASDIYFIEVRPFNQDFRRAQSQAGGRGGGGGGGKQNQPGALSEQQRQIISATFKIERDRPRTAPEKFKEDAVFVGLSQGKLREQVEELVVQMRERLGGQQSENIRQIAQLLPQATAEMKTAEAALANQKMKEGLAAEQKALTFLQRAEQLYDLEIQQGGGGGGGGQQASELADLFQLELDRQANQYEMSQSAQQQEQQAGDQERDEIAERLRELSRRQLAQADAQRRAGQLQNGSGGGASQRALAEELEQTARQLEQLSRQAQQQGQPSQPLAEAARRLQEAAASARRAAANGSDGGAQARQAARALQEAQRLVDQGQQQREQQTADDAVRRADDLVRRQREIAQGVQAMQRQGGADRQNRLQQLRQQKDQLGSDVAQLEQQLDNLGRQARSEGQTDAARRFQEASQTIRSQAIKEIIEYSKDAMAGGPQASQPAESRISSDLDTVRQRAGQAAAAARDAARGTGLNRAAQQASNLTRGLSSLQDQLEQQAGQQGRSGQQGMQGEGEQGRGAQQQGEQGEGRGDGQPGREGQGRGQGQQGQQGRGQGQGAQGRGRGEGEQGQGQGREGQQGGRGQGQGEQGQGQSGQGSGQQRLGQGGEPFGGQPGTNGDARPDGIGRQLRNQAGQFLGDAREFRNQLQAAGGSRQELQAADEVIRALQSMANAEQPGNIRGLNDLTASALDSLKKLEFELRQRTDTTSDELYLSSTEEAPARYRPLVNDYFRELSRGTKAAGDGK